MPELIAPIDVTALQKDKETRGSAYTKEDRVTEAGKRHAAGCSYYAHTYYGTAYADIINLRRKIHLVALPGSALHCIEAVHSWLEEGTRAAACRKC